jgi:hypothetical protein
LRIRFTVDEDQLAHNAASDGMCPLLTNDRDLTLAELFDAYRWQPNLEKRHAQPKGTQLFAQMGQRDPARIEGLLTCHFIAMPISSLIERAIRHAMTDARIGPLSLYPEDRGCTAPTAARILEIFTSDARHELTDLQRACPEFGLSDAPASARQESRLRFENHPALPDGTTT